jgi:hypothetical protein
VPSWQASMLGIGLVPYGGLSFWLYSGRHPYGALPVGDPALFDHYLKSYCHISTPEDSSPEHPRPQALSGKDYEFFPAHL